MTFKGGMFIIWFLMTLLFCVVLVEPELHYVPDECFVTIVLWVIVALLAIFAPIEKQPSKRQ